MIKRLLIILGLAAVLLVGGGLVYRQVSARQAIEPPQTTPVTRGNLAATVSAAGTIASHTFSALAFQTSGEVTQILVQMGDQVKAGQKLAQLDTTDLDIALANAQINLDTALVNLADVQDGSDPTDLANARGNLDSTETNYNAALAKYNLKGDQQTVARAQLDRAKTALENAQFAYDWAKNDWLITPARLEPKKEALDNAQEAYNDALHAYGSSLTGINDTALRSAEAQVALARSQLDSLESAPTPESLAIAQAQVKQAELAVQQAQLNLSKATLVAPFDGVVTSVDTQVGQTVSANAAIINLADLTRLEITIALPEVDVIQVQVGQPVTITIDALYGKELPGKVVQMAMVGQTTQNVVSYPAVVQLTGSDPDVRLGMNASLSIIIAQRQNVLIVPNRAIRTVNRQKTITIYYEGELVSLPIVVDLAGDSYSEVTQGLKEGDLVVLNATTATQNQGLGFGMGGMGRIFGGGR